MEAATGALPSPAAGESAVGRCGRDGPMEALLCSDLYCPVTLPRFRSYPLEEAGRKADHTHVSTPLVFSVFSVLKFIPTWLPQPIPWGTWQPPCLRRCMSAFLM